MKSAYIFIGRSGSGKDAQADLLVEKFQDRHKNVKIISTGELFRAFARESNSTAELVKKALSHGELLPDFLAIKLWSDVLIKESEADVIIFNGAPRTAAEAVILDSALSFYGIRERVVVYLELSFAMSETRLQRRGRADDLTAAARAKRLHWFDTDVAPAITFFQSSGRYRVLEVDGAPAIPEIHKTICKKLHIEA